MWSIPKCIDVLLLVVAHDLRHEDLLPPGQRLLLSVLTPVTVVILSLVDPLVIPSLLLVEEGSDPVLSPELNPCLFR